MAYTVKKLAKFSGVSIRTLRFYDEIGLLKPAYYGDNNYRYYEEEQLLMLQQILFYRELGFQLSDIQRIISNPDFDKVAALEFHRKILLQNLNQTQRLIQIVDKTIAHLRGKTKMKNEELYYGFDSEKQKRYEKKLADNGEVTVKEVNKYPKIYKKWTQEDKDHFIEEGKEIIRELTKAMNQNLQPGSEEVQRLMRRHHIWIWWKKYLGLSGLYQTPEFKKFYDAYESELLEFMSQAMEMFAERELS